MAAEDEKIVLITGGSSGIGSAIAQRFKSSGDTVVICGRDEDKLSTAASRFQVRPIRCDVSNADECQQMLECIERDYGRLDLLINCAGVMFSYNFAEVTGGVEMIRKEIEINAISPVTLTYLALPLLKRSESAIVVFVSSGLAYAPFAPAPVYSGTKALIHHAAQNLRHQFKPLGISVYELLPPVTDTPMSAGMNAAAFKKSSPDAVVDDLCDALWNEQYEVPSGQSKQLRLMSRLAPKFLFKRMATALNN